MVNEARKTSLDQEADKQCNLLGVGPCLSVSSFFLQPAMIRARATLQNKLAKNHTSSPIQRTSAATAKATKAMMNKRAGRGASAKSVMSRIPYGW
jgi:hypothetical protein